MYFGISVITLLLSTVSMFEEILFNDICGELSGVNAHRRLETVEMTSKLVKKVKQILILFVCAVRSCAFHAYMLGAGDEPDLHMRYFLRKVFIPIGDREHVTKFHIFLFNWFLIRAHFNLSERNLDELWIIIVGFYAQKYSTLWLVRRDDSGPWISGKRFVY